jgi:hypothetical protein
MPDDDPNTVKRLIDYMYTNDYADGRELATTPWVNSPSPGNTKNQNEKEPKGAQSPKFYWPANMEDFQCLLHNAEVYVIGDKYDVEGIKQLALAKYKTAVAVYWNSASFVASLRLMYEETRETDSAMKDIAIKAAGEHVHSLVDRGEFVALYKENGEIAFDILKASLVPSEPITVHCHECGSTNTCPLDVPGPHEVYGFCRHYCGDCNCSF